MQWGLTMIIERPFKVHDVVIPHPGIVGYSYLDEEGRVVRIFDRNYFVEQVRDAEAYHPPFLRLAGIKIWWRAIYWSLKYSCFGLDEIE